MEISEIIVRTQKEWDNIPKEFDGYIYIQNADSCIIVAERKGISVVARRSASIVARRSASVVARDYSSVVARDNASVVARDYSSVEACGNSSVEAWSSSFVVARDHASIVARRSASVVARDNASVIARDYSSVVARDNASVVAWEHASVEARGSASVVARDNASVIARDYSSVEAGGNVQIIKDSDCTNLKVRGNARIVTPLDTVQEYCDFYGITIKNDQARLYKAVKSDYSAFHDSNFKYKIGETFTSDCNDSREKQCSFGLHVSHIDWALNFGRSNNIDSFKILECAVPVDKIIIPKNTDGKVRTSELTVLREVPLEECGEMGKIILKQREKKLGRAD